MQVKRAGIAVAILVLVLASAYVYLARSTVPDDIATGPIASLIPTQPAQGDLASALNALPPTAVGMPSGAPAGQPAPVTAPKGPEATASQDIGGTSAQGRIERIYVRVAEGVLIELASAKPHQRDGMRYASIEFADPLVNGTTLTRALVPEGNAEMGIGDVVEMQFAHKTVKGPYVENFFPVAEKDKVTKLLSKAGTTLAQDYLRRILARKGSDAATGEAPNIALWKSLPFDQAIKIVRGNGKRQLAVFSDPYCPACQMFEQTLQEVDNVTLYMFMLPVIRPDRADHSKSVWCSPDRAQAWLDLTLRKKLPEAAPACDNPIAANLRLLQSVDIRATPTLVFENGQRGQGNMLASAVRERLARADPGGQQAKAQ